MARLAYLHNLIHGLRGRCYQGDWRSNSNWPFLRSFSESLIRQIIQQEVGQIEHSDFVMNYMVENVNWLT